MSVGRSRSLFPCLCLFVLTAASARSQDAASPSAPPAAADSQKPKKVWTNDDMAPGSAIPSNAAPKGKNQRTTKIIDGDPRLAQILRARLEKLDGQMRDTESHLAELKKFAAGEADGSAARDPHRGVNRMPISEQMQKLEEKKRQIHLQIEAVYDEARIKGIPPGQLR